MEARTGFRRGELLGLRWTDLDLETGQVSVKSTRVRAGKQVVTEPPKTPRSRRTIGLDAGTVAALKAWETEQKRERRWVVGEERYINSGLVFTMEEDGSTVTPNRFSIWFRAAVKRAGLRPIRLHDFRHTLSRWRARKAPRFTPSRGESATPRTPSPLTSTQTCFRRMTGWQLM
jgi:integrase